MKPYHLQYGTITRHAYAKINTYLEVLERREDGYHELCSHMQLITLHDTLQLTLAPSGCAGILASMHCDLPTLSCGEDNLVLRAARAFFSMAPSPVEGVAVEFSLQKSIPMQGGLAGGSADAAAALLALNRACGDPMNEEELCLLGARLGADVPFCIRGLQGAQTARGIGERMSAAPGLPATDTLLIVLPGTAVSTPAAFRLLDEAYGAADVAVRREENERRYTAHLEALRSGGHDALSRTAFNRFEEAVYALQPATAEVAARLAPLGADMTLMSGSGPTLVGYFPDRETAERARVALAADGIAAYICNPIEGAV